MKRLVAAAAVLLLAGCASMPVKQTNQINRTAKANKYAAPKAKQPAPMPTPNQVVTKRWFPKFRVQWLHPK